MPTFKLSNGRVMQATEAEYRLIGYLLYAEHMKLPEALRLHPRKCKKTSKHCFVCDLIRDYVDERLFGPEITR